MSEIKSNGSFAFFRGCMIPAKLPHIEYVARLILPRLGAQLVDVDEFTCCPDPVGFGAVDALTWVTIGARNISLAERQKLDILTLCNGCAYTLRHTAHQMCETPKLRNYVNTILAEIGTTYQGISKVKHFLPWLAQDVGREAIRQVVKRPLTGLRVATHTGCHLLSPQHLHNFDSPEDPVVFDHLVETLGATPVDYATKARCCGIGFTVTGQADPSGKVLSEKLSDVHNEGADCITVGCPFCYQQFDLGQLAASRAHGLNFQVPILSYLQLLGLAMGLSPNEMQLPAHKIKVEGTSLGKWLEKESIG